MSELSKVQEEIAERVFQRLEEIGFTGHLTCNGGVPYGEGSIHRDYSAKHGWVFGNGKVGGYTEPSKDFILETLYNNRFRINKLKEELGFDKDFNYMSGLPEKDKPLITDEWFNKIIKDGCINNFSNIKDSGKFIKELQEKGCKWSISEDTCFIEKIK